MTHQHYQAVYQEQVEETRKCLPYVLLSILVIDIVLLVCWMTSSEPSVQFGCFIGILFFTTQGAITLDQYVSMPPAQPPAMVDPERGQENRVVETMKTMVMLMMV
jgi:hypothetical protein